MVFQTLVGNCIYDYILPELSNMFSACVDFLLLLKEANVCCLFDKQGSVSLGKKQRQLASLGGTSKPRVLIKRARTLS